MSQIFRSFEANSGDYLTKMIEKSDQKGLPAVGSLFSDSLLGMYVHLKWRTHGVTSAQAESWLLESGLENVQCLSFDDGALCKRLSLACVGRKPRLDGLVYMLLQTRGYLPLLSSRPKITR